jgi:hypothetical protein
MIIKKKQLIIIWLTEFSPLATLPLRPVESVYFENFLAGVLSKIEKYS